MDFVKEMSRSVSIGQLNISIPALLVAIGGLLVGLIMTVKVGTIAGMVSCLGFFVAAYSLNCMIVGQCVVWAWILASVYVFAMLQSVLIYLTKK